MRRRIVMIIIILVSFILQCSIFPAISIASVKPNLLLILPVAFGLMRGKREGMFMGFFGGLMMDLFFSNVIGFHALIYTFIGYLNGCCYRIFYDDDIKMPILLVTISDLGFGLIMYGTQFLMRGRVEFFYYLKRIIIPEILFTVLVTMIIYRFLLRIHRRLEKAEQRSVGSFV